MSEPTPQDLVKEGLAVSMSEAKRTLAMIKKTYTKIGVMKGLDLAIEACTMRAERGRAGVKAGAQSCKQAIEALKEVERRKE